MVKLRRRFLVQCPRCGKRRTIETGIDPAKVNTSCFVCAKGFSLISSSGRFNRIVREL